MPLPHSSHAAPSTTHAKPVSTRQAPAARFDAADPDDLEHFIQSLRLTEACNLLGLPAVVVPVGVADGLPMGVQLIGPRFHEDLCLDAAEAVEQRLGTITPIEPEARRGS